MRTKLVLILVASLSTVLSAPWMSGSAVASAAPAPSSAATIAPTQTIVGGGTGTHDEAVRWPFWDGIYTSNSQLGSGSYEFGGIAVDNATFTRVDGTRLTGPIVEDTSSADCLGSVPCARADVTGSGDIASGRIFITLADQPGPLPEKSGFIMHGTLTLRHRFGYVMLDANGATHAFGGVDHLGDAPTTNAVDIERTPTGNGYWVVNNAGQVYAFGDAPYLGGADMTMFLAGQRITSMSSTPSGKGYWLFTSTGRALRFGDAKVFGDLRLTPLNQPIIGSVATPTGNGYYMVAADGGVFAFGDAKFRGSMGGTHLNQPVVGIVPTHDNTGYWLVASDGGVFSFNAPFRGSMGSVTLNRPVASMVAYGGGYLMVASDGGLFNFSSAPFFGSLGGTALTTPIVNASAAG